MNTKMLLQNPKSITMEQENSKCMNKMQQCHAMYEYVHSMDER